MNNVHTVYVYKSVERDEKGNITETFNKAKCPTQKHKNDSGFDAYVCFSDQSGIQSVTIPPHRVVKIPLGISCDIPEGFEIQIRPRSGSSLESKIAVLGTIDSDFKGMIQAIVANITDDYVVVCEGDRICQFVLAPVIKANYVFIEDKEIDTESTERGVKGFGSSGK